MNRYVRRITTIVFLVSFVLSNIAGQVVYADDFNSTNSIFFYDKNAIDCNASSELGPLDGSTNKPKIWNWLISQGMSENGAAGIMGNMSPESGFNPFRIQESATLRSYNAMVNSSEYNNAFGLVQWDGARRPAVLKYIMNGHDDYQQYVDNKYGDTIEDYKNAPGDITDSFLTLELQYLKKESTFGGGRPTVWKEMIASDSPGEAADMFEAIFEGSTRDAGGEQFKQAEIIYEEFHGSGTPPTPTPDSSSTSSSGCDSSSDSEGDGGPITEGGLTEGQAKTLVMNYGSNKAGSTTKAILAGPGTPSSGCSGGLLSNCTSFSAFFVNKFSDSRFQGGNGGEVVSNLKAAGVPTGSTAKVFSVFSWGGSASVGHTGIILGIHGSTVIVGEASCGSGGVGRGDGVTYGKGAAIIRVGRINSGSPYFGTVPTEFAYLKNVNTSAIQEYLSGGV